MADRDNSIGKKSYWLGGGGVNEPEPGKRKYPAEPEADRLRDKEDRQMLQTKEFGGTVADDKIREKGRPLPASERRKEAVRKAKQNLTKEGYLLDPDGKPMDRHYDVDPLAEKDRDDEDRQMLQDKDFGGKADDAIRDESRPSGDTSVNEISGGQVEQLSDIIATKEFGTKMLQKVREVGVEKAASLYKKAQSVPAAAPTAAPPADPTAAAPPGAPADDAGAESAPEDEGGKGDKKETAVELAEKVRDNASDLLEVVRDITGGQAEMGDLEQGIQALPNATASVLKPAVEMRRKLEKMLVSAAKKSLAELKEHYSELKLISEMG
ncbi:unnamed protein product [Sphagnum jensenii]